jgi:integrase/recombinase XerD
MFNLGYYYSRNPSLVIFRDVLPEFVFYLSCHGYIDRRISELLRDIPYVEKKLLKKGYSIFSEVTVDAIQSLKVEKTRIPREVKINALASKLIDFAFSKDKLKSINELSPEEKIITMYQKYLKNYLQLCNSTIKNHIYTIKSFFRYLSNINIKEFKYIDYKVIEKFILFRSRNISRASLRQNVGQFKCFLKYLFLNELISVNYSGLIENPKVYKNEKIPKSLQWGMVIKFLESIDRSTPLGLRNYACLLLIASYGLRASEVADLKISNINWYEEYITVFQRKTKSFVTLPLTASVGNSIIKYLKNGRPKTTSDNIFITHTSPYRNITTGTLSHIFVSCANLSGMDIQHMGCHCLRHSVAIKLIREGVSLKTIGDVLGHKGQKTTMTYLRLNYNDLREVPLNLPSGENVYGK